MIYQATHPEFPKSMLRFSMDDQGNVQKLYATGNMFIGLGIHALACKAGSVLTVLSGPEYIANLISLGCMVKEDKSELATNVKIALWCRLWKEYKGEKWTITGPDARRMGEMKVDEDFLRWYLNDKDMPDTPQTWLWKGKQSIGNLWHYFNQVKVAMAAPPPSKHPDHWSREHFNKLSPQDIGDYFRHLRELGLVPKKHADGTILDYIKP